jgi:hypothetical protein
MQPTLTNNLYSGDFYEDGVNHNQDELRLVSLGCFCGPKLSFRKLGRDAETLPLDWCRTRIDGIIDFLQNDFDKFLHYDTKEQINGVMTLYRSYYHSFWHDDLSKPEEIEKYRRRIERFQAIDAHSKPVLFVRAVANDDEVQHLRTLSDLLIKKFGRFAKLLAIVDFQPEDEPLVIPGCDNLLIYKLNAKVHSGHLGEGPYVQPIAEAIKWAKTGRAEGARSIQSLSTENFNPGKMAWLCQVEPFEAEPKGGMKRLPPAADGAMNGLQQQPFSSNPSQYTMPCGLQTAQYTSGSYTSGQVQSLSAGGLKWSTQALGSDERLPTAAEGAMNGSQQQALVSNPSPYMMPCGLQTAQYTSGSYTSRQVQSLSAGGLNWSCRWR